jgi:hypothetical protein
MVRWQPLLETIDMETFHQILDLDEDGTHEFSREMALAYFSQASTTFVEMDQALCVLHLRFTFPRQTHTLPYVHQ